MNHIVNCTCSKEDLKFDELLSKIIVNTESELKNESMQEKDIDVLFVIDFECNQPESEIIEFPISVVDLNSRTIIDSFHAYVKPTITT